MAEPCDWRVLAPGGLSVDPSQEKTVILSMAAKKKSQSAKQEQTDDWHIPTGPESRVEPRKPTGSDDGTSSDWDVSPSTRQREWIPFPEPWSCRYGCEGVKVGNGIIHTYGCEYWYHEGKREVPF